MINSDWRAIYAAPSAPPCPPAPSCLPRLGAIEWDFHASNAYAIRRDRRRLPGLLTKTEVMAVDELPGALAALQQEGPR